MYQIPLLDVKEMIEILIQIIHKVVSFFGHSSATLTKSLFYFKASFVGVPCCGCREMQIKVVRRNH
jgi:hypothetical protein